MLASGGRQDASDFEPAGYSISRAVRMLPGTIWAGMLARPWMWLGPLIGAAGVFIGVVWTTPPGFGALRDVLFGSPRGPSADSDAYVLGAAGSLALVTLLVLTLVSVGIEFGLRVRHRR